MAQSGHRYFRASCLLLTQSGYWLTAQRPVPEPVPRPLSVC